jgi:Phosphoribosyl transferase/TRSP domain C terminus to PRTase_2
LGAYVAERLGLDWTVHRDPYGLGLDALAGLAIRHNPKRAHLVVSTVLAKHIAAPPATVRAAGLMLAGLVGRPLVAPVVLGFCETATGLGHTVADAFPEGDYVHTTRRPDPARSTLAGFDEEHSHAVGHHLQPPAGLLDSDRPLVLVDDELTTGTTALNTVEALHALAPRQRYVLAALLDLRSAAARASFEARAERLGVHIEVVALIDGDLILPPDLLERAAPLQQELLDAVPVERVPRTHLPEVVQHEQHWPAGVPTGGRHGFGRGDRARFEEAIAACGGPLLAALQSGRRDSVLVVGVEELIYAPVRLADWLQTQLQADGTEILVQSTTRSPVLPLDQPGYAVRRRLTFASPDDPGRASYLYNVVPPDRPPAAYDHIVVVTEDPPAACAGLVEVLRPWASNAVHLVPLPTR